MARAWCFVKPGGQALVGLPSGPDMMGFNSHKVYGRIMYAQLFANWEVEATNVDFSKNDGVNCYSCFQGQMLWHFWGHKSEANIYIMALSLWPVAQFSW
jgi:hypothetical protein